MRSTIRPLTEGIQDFLVKASDRRAARHLGAAKIIVDVEPEVIAFLVLRTVISTISVERKFTEICLDIGAAVEDEVRFRDYRERNAALYSTLLLDIKRRTRNADGAYRVLNRRDGRDILKEQKEDSKA